MKLMELKTLLSAVDTKDISSKEYFYNYALHNSNVEFELADNKINLKNNNAEDWSVKCIDTGPDTQTGGRLKELKNTSHQRNFSIYLWGWCW